MSKTPNLKPHLRSLPRLVVLAIALGLFTSITIALITAYLGVQPNVKIQRWGIGDRNYSRSTTSPLHWYVFATGDGPVINKMFLANMTAPSTADEVDRFRALASDDASIAACARHEFLFKGIDAIWVKFDVTSFGWPWPCLAMERAFTRSDSFHRKIMVIDFPTDPKAAYATDPANTLSETYSTLAINNRHLPTRPLLLPLAANTALFAAAFLPLLLLVSALHRALIPKAFCKHCRYALTGLPPATPCPECGTPR